jgi:hypothetical protein
MTMAITIKRNDTRDAIKATLSNEKGVVDLTGCSIRFIMARRNKIKVDKPAIIEDTLNGVVWAIFDQGDTDEVGTFQAEFEVTFPDNRIATFPNNDYLMIEIKSDLG